MKKRMLTLPFLHCFVLSIAAQTTLILDTSSYLYLNYKQIMKQEREDDAERLKAFKYPIKSVIKDTLESDSLVQWYYHSGGLYQQVTYKNGKENGIRETYHPNGQFENKEMFVDGRVKHGFFSKYYESPHYVNIFKVYGHSYISFDRYGKLNYITYFGKYKGRKIHIDKHLCYGEPCSLMVYNKKYRLIKEYEWADQVQIWVETWYHIGRKHSVKSKKTD